MSPFVNLICLAIWSLFAFTRHQITPLELVFGYIRLEARLTKQHFQMLLLDEGEQLTAYP